MHVHKPVMVAAFLCVLRLAEGVMSLMIS